MLNSFCCSDSIELKSTRLCTHLRKLLKLTLRRRLGTWVFLLTMYRPSRPSGLVLWKLLSQMAPARSSLVRLTSLFFWGGRYTDITLLASGGFATVHPNNKLTINVIEAAPLEDFSPEARFCFFIAMTMTYCLDRLFVPTSRRPCELQMGMARRQKRLRLALRLTYMKPYRLRCRNRC